MANLLFSVVCPNLERFKTSTSCPSRHFPRGFLSGGRTSVRERKPRNETLVTWIYQLQLQFTVSFPSRRQSTFAKKVAQTEFKLNELPF